MPCRKKLKKRKLGRSGLEVSELGLGCMGMSEFYGPTSEKESISAIDRAFDLGVNFYDTADVYGSGRNEELLGLALGDRRQQAVIATKFGTMRAANGVFCGINGRPEYVKTCCEASLRRLG